MSYIFLSAELSKHYKVSAYKAPTQGSRFALG